MGSNAYSAHAGRRAAEMNGEEADVRADVEDHVAGADGDPVPLVGALRDDLSIQDGRFDRARREDLQAVGEGNPVAPWGVRYRGYAYG